MTDVYYCAGWVGEGSVPVPEESARQMAREDRQAAKQAEARAEHQRDLLENEATRAQLEGRDVTLAGVFERAQRNMAVSDARAERRALQAKVDAGQVEVLDGSMKRSQDTLSRMDEQIRQAREAHDWLIAYLVRHGGAGAVEAARAESERRYASRGVSRSQLYSQHHGPMIERTCAPGEDGRLINYGPVMYR